MEFIVQWNEKISEKEILLSLLNKINRFKRTLNYQVLNSTDKMILHVLLHVMLLHK